MNTNRIIWVSPLADGWAVICAGIEPIVFHSGGKAEAQAKRLAACLAKLGRAVQVRILDRSRTLVGSQLYTAS